MEKVDFTYKRGGRTKTVTSTQAKVLARAGLGTYQTRDMGHQPTITKPMQAETKAEVQLEPEDDGLEGLQKDELHALAKERGLTLHHMLGAEKVRAALREAAAQ